MDEENDRGGTLIWTEGGVWLQTMDGEGRRRSSYVGKIEIEHVRFFAQSRGIELLIVRPSSRHHERLRAA